MHEFYSDTQTRPTRAMRESALNVTLGDERHNEDPSTNELCARVADMLGMEAAVFLPSGTMCNEIAIAVHTRPGDEVICTRESHIIFAESGGPAALSGVMMCPIDTDRGMLSPEQVIEHDHLMKDDFYYEGEVETLLNGSDSEQIALELLRDF